MPTITISDLKQVGRLTVPDPNLPPVYVTHNADFSSAADIELDFTTLNQQQQFGVPRSLFIDNGSNPEEVEISVSQTDQFFTVPPFAQGVFKLDAAINSRIRFVTAGGATDQVTITVYNHIVPPSVWYRFGTFNNDKPIMAEGTMATGANVAAADANNPVYIGGLNYSTGLFRPVSVNDSGQIGIDNLNVTIGGVYGSETLGAAPVNPGVLTAVLNSAGNVTNLQLNAEGEILVSDADVDAELNALNTKAAPPSTGTISTVASAITDTVILAANANRKGCIIFNDSASPLNLALSNVNATLSFSIQIAAGSSFVLSKGDYTGIIKGAWEVADGSARITEFA